ncbi:MAG: M3 family oligoendopeptidase [Anaerolineaceae bacterium]|nr:M3 family oligoendopeptidase [Anaerolineaceae bacterium]
MIKTSSTYKQSRWSLNDLFPSSDSKELNQAFASLEALVANFESHRAELTNTIQTDKFLEIIKELEEITKLIQRIGGFAELWFTEDTQNQSAQSMVAKVEQLSAEISNRVLFFSIWWKSLDNKTAGKLMENTGDYFYWLEQMRHLKPFTLTEPEEKIISIKDVTGSSALVNLYDAFTNRYIFKIKIDGEDKELTRGELMTYVRMPDADLRARAYQTLYRVYGSDGPILGQMYQTRVRDWKNELIGLRGYASPISARNLNNDIPDTVIDTLLAVCQENAGIFQHFFDLKARLLGMEKLRRYDIYAPVTHSKKEYPFGIAVDLVLDSFEQFDPRFSKLAKRVIDETHVDSQIRKGKRSGAFCATVNPKLTPWVLVNYQGHSDDVATLAHELGHAIHSLLASEHSIFTQSSCLPLAETASTFGEMMLVDRLLKEEKDADVRRDLLFKQVDDSYATIMRQAFFALFEKKAHKMTSEGASVDELSAVYFENLKTQFGKNMVIGEEFKWEWVSIPHIYHVPFYVYAYAFGKLLVLSLYKQYKKEGESFKSKYINLLSTGGSKAPMDILSESGIDIRQASFWQGGFDIVADLVGQLEELS